MARSLRFFAIVLAASILGACSGGAQNSIPQVSRGGGGSVLPQSRTGPSLAWSPSGTFDFGTQTAGSQTSQVFTLTNSGRTATGVLAVALGAGTSSDFSITADTCTGTALGPKKSCSVTAQFAPAAGDNVTGTLVATGKKPAASARVNLKGNAVHTTTFSYTGAVQMFTVPDGVTQITVDVVGAAGGTGNAGAGGLGGLGEEVKATLSVTAGTLYVFVGGAGGPGVNFVAHPGFNGGGGSQAGGGGGGASDIRTISSDLTSRLIAAGGGGGGSGVIGGAENGGNAGFAAGVDGSCSSSLIACGGGGGASNGGGIAGTLPPSVDSGDSGAAGSLGLGASAVSASAGGAGGGGYYGGGSGTDFVVPAGCGPDSCIAGGGSGGGGSSFLAATGTLISDNLATSMQCDTSNDGCVTISY